MQFDMSMQKFIGLAQAMPADRFTWSPMNEHLGQSIAYARMNGIVPPWSR